MMNNDESKIIFLSKALEFYANINNYKKNDNGLSFIELDNGEQARFALRQIEDLEDSSKSYEDDYLDILKNSKLPDDFNDFNYNELLNQINKIKKNIW